MIRPNSTTDDRAPHLAPDRGAAAKPTSGSLKLSTYLVSNFLLFGALAFAFRGFMMPIWGNDFLERNWTTTPELSTAYAYMISFAILAGLSAAVYRPSPTTLDLLIHLHLIFPIMPMLVLFAERGGPVSYTSTAVLAFALMVICSRLPPLTNSFMLRWKSGITVKKVSRSIAVLAVIFLAGTAATGGLARFNLNFDRVYEFRGNNALKGPPLFGYLNTNLVAFGLPVVTALSIQKRSRIGIAAISIAAVLVFGFTSQKSHFFTPVAAAAVFYLGGKESPVRSLNRAVVWTCVIAVVLVTLREDLDRFGTWTVRRGLFGPAYLNYIWHDFFGVHGNPRMYWSDSSVSFGLTSNPYEARSPIVVGAAYDDLTITNLKLASNAANTGWLGTGYANAGIAGLMLYAVLVGGILRTVGRLEESLGTRVAFASCAFACYQLFTTADLPSTILSHGLGLFMVLAVASNPASPTTKGLSKHHLAAHATTAKP